MAEIAPPHPSPPETSDRPQGGEGEREQISAVFKPEFDLRFTGRRTSTKHLGQSPLPPGGPTFREG